MAFVTHSPQGTYRVEVVGHLSSPKGMFTEHLVEARVSRASGQPVVRAYLYRADFLDDGFGTLFDEPVWLDDNVVLFAMRAATTMLLRDEVVLRNESGTLIHCIRVKTADVALTFDLAHGSEQPIVLAREPGAVFDHLSLMTWGDSPAPVVQVMRDGYLPPDRAVKLTIVLKGDGQVEWLQPR